MKTKTLKLMMVALGVLLSINANAYDVEIDGIYYNVIQSAKTAEVTNGNNKYTGEVIIPETIKYDGVTYKVTSIGEGAFLGCSGLTSIDIPNGVTRISTSAFRNCSGLTSIIIPSNITDIGKKAFRGCSSLTLVKFEESGMPLYIKGSSDPSDMPFDSSVVTLYLGRNIVYYPYSPFAEMYTLTSLTIGNHVTSIDHDAFRNCRSLTSVTIPNSVTSIGDFAFENCSGLTSVTIPNSVTSIGDDAFKNTPWYNNQDDGLIYIGSILYKYKGTIPENTEIIIKEGIKKIGGSAFSGCSGLTSVTIPNSVTYIGSKAFYGCSGLTSLTIGTGLGDIGTGTFNSSKLKNIYLRSITPLSLYSDAFSQNTYNHATLYVPNGSWTDYAYNDNWGAFIHIKEVATTTDDISESKAYTLMNTRSFSYAIYDPVTDAVMMVSSQAISENNPNHNWQMKDVNGKTYLYNIGAKKFAIAATHGDAIVLSSTPNAIAMSNNGDGIILGTAKSTTWNLVENNEISASHDLEDMVTSIDAVSSLFKKKEIGIYDLNGKEKTEKQKGVNIIRMEDGKTKKVLVR